MYPGHGIRFVTRTGQLVVLSTSKVSSLYHQRKKPAKLYWTLASRRAHKKLNTEAGIKKRARRVVKVQRVYGDKEKMAETKAKVARPAGAAAAAPKTKSGKLIQAAVAEAKAKQKASQEQRKKAGAGAAKPAAAATKHAGKGR